MTYVLLDDQGTGKQLLFREAERIITARTRADLPAAFDAIEAEQARGKWLAGSMAYELGHALESHFEAPQIEAPLIQLGVFDAPVDHPPVDWLYTRSIPDLEFVPSWSEADYLARFDQVQRYLQAGDCYQVNLTFPLYAESRATAQQVYAAFRRRQPGRYGAVVSLGGADIVSFSPELFFERRGQNMRMRPMKGTRPRHNDAKIDAAILAEMRAEPKSQAENLMIVDLLRNDLSRLCEAGSVKVPELFTLETYPTLHQMTSQVTGRLRPHVKWAEILRGLFPCGSVTGAPKIRAMEIIQDLELGPREAYCGSVGYIAPNGDASFSVAIRTVQMRAGILRYDVGSGVVLDSEGSDEYRECLLKSQIFQTPPENVFETFRRTPTGEIPNANLHISRMAEANGTPLKTVQAEFKKIQTSRPQEDLRVRFEQHGDGFKTTFSPYLDLSTPLKLAISRYPLTEASQMTVKKTTRRDFYDGERERIGAGILVDEVIFLNANEEVCEGSFTTIFVEKDGQLYTPDLSSGLLPGILRQHYLETGKAESKVLTLTDLSAADAIYVGNSLRGLMPAQFINMLRH
ncbi:aminodeoxychorismate synthase, component I [Litorimonas cladophorae]|uniref:Aminodeoxychorismate synthase, component I n=1 Tax=Litorimonas cladophorae TaxID=1220491 RepID=A0A918KU22_9PROT|nr:aminodeoxychorismate synthase component I [Litorimonas cladophorae]GGX73509.1 aminodeoxychorismate synthase, component I [Litorimonas cladophorae]